jgi:hypothetical protein
VWSERMKKLGLFDIYWTGSWLQLNGVMATNRVIWRIMSKIDPYQKMDKILKNHVILNGFQDFVQFCAILIGFCLFLGFYYIFESLKLSKVAKSKILGLSRDFDYCPKTLTLITISNLMLRFGFKFSIPLMSIEYP